MACSCPPVARRSESSGSRSRPGRMPAWQARRPLKRWHYVGVFGPELQLCVGDARIGPIPLRWWALAEPGEPLREGTARCRARSRRESRVKDGDVEIALELDEADARRDRDRVRRDVRLDAQAGGRAGARHGRARRPRRSTVDARAVVDDSAGYHPRHTAWKWSAGVGRADRRAQRSAGTSSPGSTTRRSASERTVWVEGDEPAEVAPVAFADDLASDPLRRRRGAALHASGRRARTARTCS